MKHIRFITILSLLFAFFLFSCSEKDLLTEEVNQVPPQEIPVDVNDESFISSEQAAVIADKYLNSESDIKTRTFANASVETVRDKENSNSPAMYVVNYPEGGFVVVSATEEYFPVLAYSDENKFDIETVSQSGVSVWMEETKAAIRLSGELDAETKAQIRTQWLAHGEAKMQVSSEPQTRSWQLYNARVAQLRQLYPGWAGAHFYTLESIAQYNDIDPTTILQLLGCAQDYSSLPEYSIVGYRSTNTQVTNYQKGPLLSTAWGQGRNPRSSIGKPLPNNLFYYNAWCPPNGLTNYQNNYLAGCVAVAVGQIMNYHRKPNSYFNNANHPEADLFHPIPGWSHVFNWSNMQDNLSNPYPSSLPVLLRAVGEAVYMDYGYNFSGSNILAAQNALKNIYGYTTATIASHNSATVRTNIQSNRPVYMRGQELNSASGHAWVCDGVKIESSRYEYFVEFSIGNSYNNGNGYYSPLYPAVLITNYDYYHMNWGWGGEHDGWYAANNIANSEGNYTEYRQNLYITP